jgi:hypothetical protein
VRLIGDNACESDRLDADRARRGVELIARTAEREHREPKTVAPCVATNEVEDRATLCLVPEFSAAR